MTYCVGLLLDGGLVMAADTRTNAGVDNVGKFKKLYSWERPGHAVFVLLTAGNLAITQAVVSLLSEGTQGKLGPAAEVDNLFAAKTMFQAARSVGKAVREVKAIDGDYLRADGDGFAASFIFAGQIGEHKYGKPIMDRVARNDMKLDDAAKMVLLSFDSTLRFKLSVGLPIDLLTYEAGSLKIEHTKRIGLDDPYFKMLSAEWSKALRAAFMNIAALHI